MNSRSLAARAASDGEEIPLTDPAQVPDILATGSCEPEFLEGLVRLTWYAVRQAPVVERERVVVCRLVLTYEGFENCLAKTGKAAAAAGLMPRPH